MRIANLCKHFAREASPKQSVFTINELSVNTDIY